MLSETKKWFQSKGINGGVISILAGISVLTGVGVDTEALSAQIAEIATGVASLAGGLLSTYGRAVAQTKILWK